jgi:hypothetical protein
VSAGDEIERITGRQQDNKERRGIYLENRTVQARRKIIQGHP